MKKQRLSSDSANLKMYGNLIENVFVLFRSTVTFINIHYTRLLKRLNT